MEEDELAEPKQPLVHLLELGVLQHHRVYFGEPPIEFHFLLDGDWPLKAERVELSRQDEGGQIAVGFELDRDGSQHLR